MRSDIGMIIAIIVILAPFFTYGFVAGDSGEGEDKMADIISKSDSVKDATISNANQGAKRLTMTITSGNTATITISGDVITLGQANSKITGASINGTTLDNAWTVTTTTDSITLVSKTQFPDTGTFTYSDGYVKVNYSVVSYKFTRALYLTVNVVDTTISFNTGTEWVTGTPYVNTGSESAKAKAVYVHDGTGWQLSK